MIIIPFTLTMHYCLIFFLQNLTLKHLSPLDKEDDRKSKEEKVHRPMLSLPKIPSSRMKVFHRSAVETLHQTYTDKVITKGKIRRRIKETMPGEIISRLLFKTLPLFQKVD
jgi:hypothetical protein